MQQSTEKDTRVAFQRLSITPETQKHGNELKELTISNTTIFTAIEILCKEKKKCPVLIQNCILYIDLLYIT